MADPQPVNEALFDRAVSHQIRLQRLSTGIVHKIIALLNRVEGDIVSKLIGFEPGARTEWGRKRLDKMLEAVREINRDAYTTVERSLRGDLIDLAQHETDFWATAINTAIPIRLDIVTPPLEHLVSAVTSRPFQGAIMKEWAERLEQDAFRRLRDAVRMGFTEGETIDQMVRRVRGTKARQFKDGILDLNRRNAEAVVRTAVNHTASAARETLFDANADIIKGVRWVSTLDGRTTPICISRDGKVFPIGEGPRPPAHWNCRSATVPITKSWKEIGIGLEDAPPGTRASMNGQVPADVTYGEWLRKQPRDFVEEVLGKTKARLFLDGNLTVDRFVHANGRPLTLAELKARDREAFTQAGIDGTRASRGTREARELAFREYLGQERYERIRVGAETSIAETSTTRRRLSQAELVALHGYTTEVAHDGPSMYQRINGALRRANAGELRKLDPFIGTLRSAIEKLPLYRGFVERRTTLPENVLSQLEEGGRFGDPAFLSTSIGQTAFQGPHVLIIGSRSGRRISGYSRFPAEDEVIFLPGHPFRVTKVWREGSQVTIYLKDEEG